MPYWCTKFERNRLGEGYFLAQSCCFKLIRRRRKYEENWTTFRNVYLVNYVLSRFSSNLVCKVVYMKGIKYVNLIEIGPVVIEIQGVENGDLVVPVNNTLVCRTSFLAVDTRLCVLIKYSLNFYKKQ